MQPRHLLLLVAALALALAACSDQTKGSSGADISLDSLGGADVYDPTANWTPVEQLTIDTGVSEDDPMAGEVVTVMCKIEGLAMGQPEPAHHWEIWKAPDPEPLAPEITGAQITFRSLGEYQLRCIIDETQWSDPTPARVNVVPGVAVMLETTVSPNELMAGDIADVICEGEDAYGNKITDGWLVDIAPGNDDPPGVEGGLVEANMKVKALTVGSYLVACQQDGGAIDDSPAEVTVTHGLPYKIVTLLGEDSIEAGSSTTVGCRAEDKQGNVFSEAELPMSIVVPDGVEFMGVELGSTIANSYVIKCVPQGLEWSAFVLESAVLKVTPGPPVSLELGLQPPSPFFPTYKTFTVTIIAHDIYGNLVPDAEVEELEVSPDGFHKITSGTTMLVKEEGYYTITTRLVNDPSVEASIEVAIEGAPPDVVVTYPPRGATIQGFKPSVTVEGIAQDEIAGITAVRVNGVNAALHDDGTFTKIVIPKWGLNILYVEAEDGGGAVTSLMQTFYFAEKYYPLEPEIPYIPDALKVWLDKDFIDDGVHNPTHPDDLATILEVVVADFDMSSMLPCGMEIALGYELCLSNLQMNPPTLNLTPAFGGLDVHIELKNFSLKAKLENECEVLGIDFCPDFSGGIGVDKIILDAFLQASAVEGNFNIALLNTNVTLEHIDVTIDGILGWLLDPLIDFLVNIFAGQIADLVEDMLGDELGDTLADLVSALAISETFNIDPLLPGMDPMSLTLDTIIWTLAFTPAGGQLGLAARILATKKVAHNILGSIARGTCVKGLPVNYTLPGTDEFELAAFDDFINELLTAIWYNGVLNLTIDDETLASGDGFDLGGLPVDSLVITTDFLLPPILNGCDGEGFLKLQVGDAFIDVELESLLFGTEPAQIGVYLAAELIAELLLDETPEGVAVSILIHELETLEFHWEYVPELFENDTDVLEQLIQDELIDALLADVIGQPLGNFVIPEINLGDLSPMFGTGVVLAPVLNELVHENGHTLIQGELE